MTWSIPWKFVPGTKAKANEVNENFTSLKQFVDQLETNVANNEVNIQLLEDNKANLNGSSEQRFAVANAVNTKDAMNKESVNKAINNSVDVVRGLDLYKYNDNTIACSSGSCYDSKRSFIIITDTSLSKQIDNLSASATYYIYVTAKEDNSESPQLVASLSSTTPELPSGYNKYRRLGRIETDSNKTIKDIYNDDDDQHRYVGFIGAELGDAKGTTTLTENRWLYVEADGDRKQIEATINGIRVSKFRCTKDWADAQSALIPCMKGQTVAVSGNGKAKWLKMVY